MQIFSIIYITIPISDKLFYLKSQVEQMIIGFGLSHHINGSVQAPDKNVILDSVSQLNRISKIISTLAGSDPPSQQRSFLSMCPSVLLEISGLLYTRFTRLFCELG